VYLSREAGWYDVDGNALYIRKGEKFADSDPAVKAAPSIFDKISDDGPPVKAAVKTRRAPTKTRKTVKAAPKRVARTTRRVKRGARKS
jgi:hypothetical protein